MDVKRFSLAHLGMSDEGPLALVEAAGAAGFRAVGLPLRSGALKPLAVEIVGNRALIRDIKAACAASGVAVFDAEALVIGHEPAGDELKRVFETAAELGASRMSCLGAEPAMGGVVPSAAESAERLARLCAAAAGFGLSLGVEFMMFRAVRTLGDASRLIDAAGVAAGVTNVGIILDALHLWRSNGTVAEVAALPPGRISHCQLCDAGPDIPVPSALVEEARGGRLLPGAGVIPLRALLAALPPDVPLALEIPVRANAHRPVAERAALGAAALRALQE